MRIYQVLHGVDNPSAGTTPAVGHLSHYLAGMNHEVTVVALGTPPHTWPHQSSLRIFGGCASRLGLAPMQAIRYVSDTMVRHPGILHGHGVWRMANLLPLMMTSNAPGKVVWSPQGMLTPWSLKYRAWRKWPFWYALQRPALNKVHSFHATSQSEVEDIRRLGFKQPVALIPNGVELPDLPAVPRREQTVVFLGRIHEKKGLHLLIPVWNDIATEFPDWELRIAGKVDSSYGKRMVRLSQELGVPRIKFLGEVLGAEKASLLTTARLFVLPTFSENFGLAVAEALAHATPVITTVHTPWTDLHQCGCGWTISSTAQELRDALRSALSLPGRQLEGMGMNGRRWMEEEFTWMRVARMFEQFYQWVLDWGERPAFVHTQ